MLDLPPELGGLEEMLLDMLDLPPELGDLEEMLLDMLDLPPELGGLEEMLRDLLDLLLELGDLGEMLRDLLDLLLDLAVMLIDLLLDQLYLLDFCGGGVALSNCVFNDFFMCRGWNVKTRSSITVLEMMVRWII